MSARAPRPWRAAKRNPSAASAALAEIARRAAAPPAQRECDWCGGSGRISEVEGIPEPVDVRCNDCEGSGMLPVEVER